MTSPSSTQQQVTSQALRRFMRGWPTGLAIVTTSAGGLPAGCTVNAFISVSLHPPLLLVSLAESSRTLAAITEAALFAINVLAGRQLELARSFSSGSADRFGGVPHHWKHGVPVLTDACAAVVCAVDRVIPATDHLLVFGSPLWCACDDSADPLVMAGGAYYVMSPDGPAVAG